MSTDSEDDEISHEPEEFESYAPYLKLFFGLDKAKIRKVIDAVNKEGSAISYSKISRMTDLPVGSAALGVLDSLSYLGHSALAHESLEEDIKNSELADDTKEGIRHFVKTLEQKGKEGLNIRFWAFQSSSQRPRLRKMEAKTQLSTVEDESNIIGFIPIMRVTFHFEDENERMTSETIQIPVEKFATIIETFSVIHEAAKVTTNHFREKLGDSVVYGGDE